MRMIPEADAVEDVLAGRQTLDQRLGGEIALRQRVDDTPGSRRGSFRWSRSRPEARRPFGARPHHTDIEQDVARL